MSRRQVNQEHCPGAPITQPVVSVHCVIVIRLDASGIAQRPSSILCRLLHSSIAVRRLSRILCHVLDPQSILAVDTSRTFAPLQFSSKSSSMFDPNSAFQPAVLLSPHSPHSTFVLVLCASTISCCSTHTLHKSLIAQVGVVNHHSIKIFLTY